MGSHPSHYLLRVEAPSRPEALPGEGWTIWIDGKTCGVAGIAPQGFTLPASVRVYSGLQLHDGLGRVPSAILRERLALETPDSE